MAKKKTREEFSKPVKRIIASRAGYRCGFPGCHKTLIGPGQKSDDFISIGECSHIFSAVKDGPRTDGGLSPEDLKKPENGIYLCRTHHQIVDTKSQDNKYTSDLLTRYKNRHEFQISGEIGEYMYPLNWINSFKIAGTIFENELNLNLGKVTFIYGSNGVGKSALIEVFYSIFSQRVHPRWSRPNVNFKAEVGLDNPVISKFSVKINHNDITYIINEKEHPFVSFPFEVFTLKNDVKPKKDHIGFIAETLGFGREDLINMLKTTSLKHGLFTKEVVIRNVRKRPYVVDQLDVALESGFRRTFGALSGTEKSRVILDILISYVTELSKYKSVLLLLDWEKTYSFSDGSLSPYLEYLQSSNAHFQTLFVSHKERPKLDWTGWVIAKLIDTDNCVQVIQTER
jgi:hypothetical protein